jgi:DNA invertase Pin-like site-specific DNA recombinase
MALVGYARVSTIEQSTKVQLAAFERYGITDIYEEKKSSVKRRPVLDSLVNDVLQPGDTLYVYKLDRLARSMTHFVRLFEVLRAKQVGFKSLTESIETETPQGRMFLQLLGVFAEFERELIRERCLAGQIAARARGQVWGKKPMFTPCEARQVARLWRGGWAEQIQLAYMFDCSESTLRDTIHRAERRGRWANRPSDK